MKVIDNKGKIYESVRDFSRKTNCARSHIIEQFRNNGFYVNSKKGIELKPYDENAIEDNQVKDPLDKVLSDIKERYSPQELKLLAKGQGLSDPNLKFQKVFLYGKHHKIGVMSDGHLGSKYSPIEYHKLAFETFEKENCEFIIHCGDVVEGLCPNRAKTQIYELSHIGYSEQMRLAISVFKQCNLPVYMISGNHDYWYIDFGGNIVEEICSMLPNLTYLGHNQADMNIDGITIRVFHGNDGSSYALSYRLQKLVESYASDDKPNILLCGHVHKQTYIYERDVHCLNIPCLQEQTPFMKGKKISAHVGFDIIEFDTNNGKVCNFKLQYFPL